MSVPAEWTLAAVGGDERSGYLRVDDERMPRVQVKWSQGHINLERKRQEYARRLAFGKRRWKRPTGLEVDTGARILSQRSKPKKELAGFAWRGRHCGMGLLWNCEVCKRSLLAQVSWLDEESASGAHETAREVLGSLEDHGAAGWRWWGLDGLTFLAPERYQMQKYRRLTRYLEMQVGRERVWAKVARWGMVPLVLQERTVQEWLREHLSGRREIASHTEEMDIKDHEGAAAWGEVRRFAGGLRRVAGRVCRRPPPPAWAACAWHCPEANRLYLVESLEPEQGEVLKGVVDSIICHHGGAGSAPAGRG